MRLNAVETKEFCLEIVLSVDDLVDLTEEIDYLINLSNQSSHARRARIKLLADIYNELIDFSIDR